MDETRRADAAPTADLACEVGRVRWLYLQVLRERILNGTYLSERRLRTAVERMVQVERLEEEIGEEEPPAWSPPRSPC